MSRTARRRIRANIYKDGSGLATVARANRQQREKRWPFGTPIETLEAWIKDTQHTLLTQKPKSPRGTIGRDADRYYRSVRDLVSFVARRAEIRAWIAALGAGKHRSHIKHEDIRRVRGEWLKAGKAPKTINSRVFALRHLYRTLDGIGAKTPCDDVKPLPVHRRPAVRVDDGLIRTIYENLLDGERRGTLRDAKTRARFMVFASTGKRPSEIGRAQREDVDFARGVWIPRDGKGGYCPGVVLNPDMVEAWQLFAAADAWGEFDSGSFAKRIREAGLPDELDPYQLRHTVGIALSEAGIDLRDIADHLGHKRTETTRRHYVPVLHSRMAKVSAVLGERQLGWKAADETPRLKAAKTGTDAD
jgi:integrase